MKKSIILVFLTSIILLCWYYYKSVLEQDEVDTYSDIDFTKHDHEHLNNV